ncbi:hypothetical protein COOONC_00207, partial [Cooperia oncophora]
MSQSSISQRSGHPIVEDSWTSIIDLGDLDLFTGAPPKENHAAIQSVFEMGGNLSSHSALESPQKSISFTASSICQTVGAQSEITSADQEFDQIFSSLENNTNSSNAFPFDFHGGENNANLSPVQFTPPDSPACSSEPSVTGLFAASTSSIHHGPSHTFPLKGSTQSFGNCKRRNGLSKPVAAPSPSSFKKEPLVTLPVQKCNKIPVYKQRRVDVAVYYESRTETKRGDIYCHEYGSNISVGPYFPHQEKG